MYACICHAVPVDDVAACIEAGAHDENAVAEATGAGTSCGSCLERICELISARVPGHGLLQRTG